MPFLWRESEVSGEIDICENERQKAIDRGNGVRNEVEE
jgi:hypothetical protein